MRPLHRMNPPPGRLDRRSRASEAQGNERHPRIDVGCGAGLAPEGLARQGFTVFGIDAAAQAIKAAQSHAAGQNLPVSYRVAIAEELAGEGQRFPVVTALEVIEHVPDPSRFVTTLASLLEPGGQLFLSTLNRTPQSFLAAKIGAEYLLRWLPVGTHDWRKFITPAEMGSLLRGAGLRVADLSGMTMNPLTGRWRLGRDLSVNYIVGAEDARRAPSLPRRVTNRAPSPVYGSFTGEGRR